MSGVYEKVWNFEHLIYSDQRWFPPNFRIVGCLWWILAQNNGPLKVRKFNIPFGMYLVHAITTYRLRIVPNTTHTITVCTRYLPGTYHVHTWYANLVRAQAFCQKILYSTVLYYSCERQEEGEQNITFDFDAKLASLLPWYD